MADKTLIQAALDSGTIDECIALIREVRELVDIIEIGTPQIFRYGTGLLTALREAFPSHTLLFDGKIVDAGAEETRIALDAGADIVTVLAAAHDDTIRYAIGEAHNRDKRIFADMLGVADIATRAEGLLAIGVDIIGLHIAVDVQDGVRGFDHELVALRGVVPPERIAVAGGVDPGLARKIAAYRPGIVIAGGALRRATDKRKLLTDIRGALEG